MSWCCVKIDLPCQYLRSCTSGTCENSKQTFLTQEHGKYLRSIKVILQLVIQNMAF